MNVTYIYHSCFLTETARCYYLFDYFKGSLPALDLQKPILVLASHSHGDHYSPTVFSILREMGMQQIFAVLSDDIPFNTVPSDISCITISPCREYDLPLGQKLVTYRSTDQGVAFLIQDQDVLFYHAGDLNDWTWDGEEDSYNKKMTRDYREQIDALAQQLQNRSLNAAFVVLDPRQEQFYDRGMLYFLNKTQGDCVYPMHYWGKPQITVRFLTEHPEYKERIRQTEIHCS
ncbi:MAG: MBL fold metallo-hydrolase [Lachnospiraceae bacterium]